MAINANWNRWIMASVSKHFLVMVSDIKIIDGMDKDDLDETQIYAEFRMDGPRFHQNNKREWRVWFAVNIIITSGIDKTDLSKKHDLIGEIANAFNLEVGIYKYGSGGGDDDSLLGCATRVDEFPVRVNQLGQIDKDLRMEQATIEGHYEIYLTV